MVAAVQLGIRILSEGFDPVTSLRPWKSFFSLTFLLGCSAGGGQEPRPRGVDAPRPVAIQLIRADAEHAAERLKILLGSKAKIDCDKETNTVFLHADPKGVERAKALLVRLDALQYDYIFRLENAEPVLVAKVAGCVMAVLAFFGEEPAATVSPLERDRAILITATDAQATFVRWLVRQLDRREWLRVATAPPVRAELQRTDSVRWLAQRLIYAGAPMEWPEWVLGRPDVMGSNYTGPVEFWLTRQEFLSTYVTHRITVLYDSKKRVIAVHLH